MRVRTEIYQWEWSPIKNILLGLISLLTCRLSLYTVLNYFLVYCWVIWNTLKYCNIRERVSGCHKTCRGRGQWGVRCGVGVGSALPLRPSRGPACALWPRVGKSGRDRPWAYGGGGGRPAGESADGRWGPGIRSADAGVGPGIRLADRDERGGGGNNQDARGHHLATSSVTLKKSNTRWRHRTKWQTVHFTQWRPSTILQTLHTMMSQNKVSNCVHHTPLLHRAIWLTMYTTITSQNKMADCVVCTPPLLYRAIWLTVCTTITSQNKMADRLYTVYHYVTEQDG